MLLDWKSQFCKMCKLYKANYRFKLPMIFCTEVLCTHKTLNSQDHFEKKEQSWRFFSGGPVAKTPFSQCRGPRFDP